MASLTLPQQWNSECALALSLSSSFLIFPLYQYCVFICSCSNYTLRSFPIPSHDVSKVVGKEGVDEALAKIQCCISRNHSNERFGIELAVRHKRRLLTAAQQSVSTISQTFHLQESLCSPLCTRFVYAYLNKKNILHCKVIFYCMQRMENI